MTDDDPDAFEPGDVVDRFERELEGSDEETADEESPAPDDGDDRPDLGDEAAVFQGEPVTSSSEDSVGGGIDYSEHETPSAGGRDVDGVVETAAVQNADSDDETEAVVACRGCQEEFDSLLRFRREHKLDCNGQHELARAFQEIERGDGPDPDTPTSYLVDPNWHEVKAYVKYDDALDVYFGLNSLQKESDWSDGSVTTTVEHGDRTWEVQFEFKDSGIKPRATLDFQLQNVREYLVKVHPRGCDHDDGGIAKSTFTVSPRWPEIESEEGARPISNPYDIEGLDVEYNGSNIDLEDYPHLFQEALAALRELQGQEWSSPTYIPVDDVAPERIHKSSNITDAELQVRLAKDKSGPLYAIDGPIHRLSLLLADEREGFAKSIRDDTECAGYYHVATIGSTRAGEVIGDHRLGKEVKHYHMRNPDANAGEVTGNPKFGVAFQHSRTDETVFWHERDRLERELDEVLLNCLDWAGIPTRPDGQYYVADDHFEAEGRSRFRRLVDNPLPQLESEQRGDVLQVMANLAPTDGEVLEHLVTDGGRHSPAEIAQGIGRAISTVYKSLKRLGPVVDHEYGDVQLRSRCVAQEVVGMLDDAREAVDRTLSGAVERLVEVEQAVDEESSAWDRWRNRYGVRFPGDQDEYGREILRMGFKPADARAAKEIIHQGARYWSQLRDRKWYEFGYEFAPEIETAEDGTWSPEMLAQFLR